MTSRSRVANLMKPALISPGEQAPEFEANDLHGNLIHLTDFRGQPVLLYFLRGFM
jgi:peroxiredoxin